jgi:capsid protein
MASTFSAARSNAQTLSWPIGTETSPDYDLNNSNTLKQLRLLSRQLIKDNCVAAAIQQSYITIIGYPAIKIYGKNDLQTRKLNELINLESLDITESESIVDLIEQIVAWSFSDGDILISLPIDTDREGIQTVVELVEAQRIKTPNDLLWNKQIRLGVEYEVSGKVKGYWVKNADKVDYEGDSSNNFTFFPCYKSVTLADGTMYRRKVTQLFKAPLNSRPKSSRQFPVITPAIHFLKQLGDFIEATVVGARVAACFSVFVKTNNPGKALATMTTDYNNGDSVSDPTSGQRASKLQPGQITYMRPGEDVSMASPNKPGDNTDAFIVRLLKIVSAYVRIPYPILFLDTAEVNYSSWRGAVLETKRFITRWRRKVDSVITWITDTMIEEAVLKNLVSGNVKDVSITIRWPSLGMLDPEKEGRASKLALNNKTKSRRMLVEEEGNDYDEVMEEINEEANLALEEQAELISKRQEYEKKGLVFPETAADADAAGAKGGDYKPKTRPGESVEDGDISEDDKKERRKEDGNW